MSDINERLTYRNQYGEVDLFDAELSILREGPETEREVNALTAALEKLANYEDAEAEGWIARLPCKVGDIVYFLCGNVAQRSEVIAYYISENKTEFLLTRTDVHSSYYVSVKEMGKTVFLTRAEAEAALQAQDAARPRADGEWRESGDGFFDFVYCSVCGHKELRETSLPPLCPVCGARMAQ